MGLGDTNLLLDRQTTTAKDCNQAAQTLDNALAALGAAEIAERIGERCRWLRGRRVAVVEREIVTKRVQSYRGRERSSGER